MNRHLTYSLILAATVGCSGGSNDSENPAPTPTPTPEPQVLTGTIDNIGGLGFETATQSGVTTLSGDYEYLEGETVTFSLGGSVIAEVAAAESYTLFELLDADAELPKTAKDLRIQLRSFDGYRTEHTIDYEDRVIKKGGTASGIHLAINKARVLMAMDDDQDFTNGINLIDQDWHTKLKDEVIDFNMPFDEFASNYVNFDLKVLQAKYDLPMPFNETVPAIALYQSADVTVPGKTLVGTSPESYDVKEFKRTSTGFFTSEKRLYTNGSTYETTYEYDSIGQITERATINDSEGDGLYESKTVLSYMNNDYGTRDTYINKRYQNNDDENPTYHYEQQYEFLDNLFDTERVGRRFNTEDGAVESHTYYSFKYDENYNMTADIRPEANQDGEKSDAIYYQYLMTYDNQGRLTSIRYENGYDIEGNPLYFTERTYSYDSNSVVMDYYIRDKHVNSETTEYTEAGTILSANYVEFQEDEQTINNELPTSYEYDDNGRITSCQYEWIDTDNSGHQESQTARTFTWGENGIESLVVTSSIVGGADFTDTILAVTYGEEGEWTYSNSYNDDAYYLYEEKDNALGFILHDYLKIEKYNIDLSGSFCNDAGDR